LLTEFYRQTYNVCDTDNCEEQRPN
jgi:hypothetical protein